MKPQTCATSVLPSDSMKWRRLKKVIRENKSAKNKFMIMGLALIVFQEEMFQSCPVEQDGRIQICFQAEYAFIPKADTLRTGHCPSRLHRMKMTHSGECPCGTGSQTPNCVLQSCPTLDTLRRHTWHSPVDAHKKLLGLVKTLRQTGQCALLTGLKS